MDFQRLSLMESLKNSTVTIHAISTGSVSVKTKFRETKHKGIRAVLAIFFDKKFTEWMPVWTWVIEHPEGIFLIDTGSSTQINNKDYFKSSGIFLNWINRKWFKFRIKKEEDIENQLHSINLDPNSINSVIITHLHLDHIDGLSFFENSTILVNKTEWEKPYGHLPKLFPKWFCPIQLELHENIFGFKGKYLTQSKDLIAIHTPGHTHGHLSVLLKTNEHWILFAGDVCYYEDQLLKTKFSGGNVDPKSATDTYKKIKQFCKENKVIVLPSHDKEAAFRLKNKIELKITEEE